MEINTLKLFCLIFVKTCFCDEKMNSLRKINRNSNFNRFSVLDNNFGHNLFVRVSQSIDLYNRGIASSQPTFTIQNSSRLTS